MKAFTIATFLLSASTTVLADFLLYDGAIVTEAAEPIVQTRAVSLDQRGNCDGIDNSPELDGAAGEYSYPWPEETFKVGLCNISLRFIKNGNDYNVYDDGTGGQVGVCTRGSNEVKACFWGFISAEYNEAYICSGAC
ncbi:uncharacterized protein B0I36DRAFT_358808 [Microdochium trichocladiopsis]|uniref:Uncharacterized protein n=1 Tax=Microdochium trichocladiopsis TaxID=1682393 RepID=A0A9P9BTZ3_9PEZI|nr:uncharacterized protein B0I36DRAFT_358808 [Microdochium trichocladiopsis]KAH7037061.1 hypothetical protein B0I36DRAFT_358808 [Microdochium trichocladiopsis]